MSGPDRAYRRQCKRECIRSARSPSRREVINRAIRAGEAARQCGEPCRVPEIYAGDDGLRMAWVVGWNGGPDSLKGRQ